MELLLSPSLPLVPLPIDFYDTIVTWVVIANCLLESGRSSVDEQLEGYVIAASTDVVDMIDRALYPLDVHDIHLPSLRAILCNQYSILVLLYDLFRDSRDVDRCIHLARILPQLCDPLDAEFLERCSQCLNDALWLKLSEPRESPSRRRLRHLLQGHGFTQDFIENAKFVVKKSEDVSKMPASIRDLGRQSQLVLELSQVIADIDDIMEQCIPKDEDRESLSILIVIQVPALRQPHHRKCHHAQTLQPISSHHRSHWPSDEVFA